MVNGEKARNVLHIGIPVASKVQWEPHVKACLALFFFSFLLVDSWHYVRHKYET